MSTIVNSLKKLSEKLTDKKITNAETKVEVIDFITENLKNTYVNEMLDSIVIDSTRSDEDRIADFRRLIEYWKHLIDIDEEVFYKFSLSSNENSVIKKNDEKTYKVLASMWQNNNNFVIGTPPCVFFRMIINYVGETYTAVYEWYVLDSNNLKRIMQCIVNDNAINDSVTKDSSYLSSKNIQQTLTLYANKEV